MFKILATLVVWGLAIAYIISPVDIITDLLPVIGWADDLGGVGLACFLTKKIWSRD